VWQESIAVAREIYQLVLLFPTDERYGLSSQMKRCAVSIASNIAEGSSRQSPKEFIHFLSISRGSVSELETQLTIAVEVGLVQQEQTENLLDALDKVGRSLNKLQSSLRSNE